ncbi:MAG: hypothetical protein Q7T54_01330 [Candidatus Levybacteria bacterium]|nr:hypothetical protein [Candidatus Levybacteria bacterium]
MNKIIYLLVFIVFFLIFGPWFFNTNIIGGDWPFFYPEFLSQLPFVPPAWSSLHGNGLGARIIVYSLDSYLYATYHLGSLIGLSWQLTYKILWFGMFLFLSVISSFYLARQFKIDSKFAVLSSLIYSTNTYILMVVGGGQMGVALGYAIVPLVFGQFINQFNSKSINYRNTISTVLTLALLMTFDIRIFYIASFAIMLYFTYLVYRLSQDKNLKKLWRGYALKISVPYILALFLNSYWLFPNIAHPTNPLQTLGQAYTSTESLRFFSFATLSNTLSILHPNWPENIFGKVSFQSPLFLTLPVIAFLALILKNRNKKKVSIIVLLGLMGVFLAKGANAPFGEIYVFLFEKIPGFQMFRDPTKWYTLAVMSYSVLIPLVLSFLSYFLARRNKWLFYIPAIVFIGFWVLLSKEAVVGKLGGTFSEKSVPPEYVEFKNQIFKDQYFYRTLWVPRQQRFTYSDSSHPSMEASPLFNATNAAEIVDELKKESSVVLLRELSIKYVVIPSDPLSEIFLKDRKYSPEERLKTEKLLDSVSYLKKIKQGKLTIYQTPNNNGLFSVNNESVEFERISSAVFSLSTNFSKPEKVVFSQKFDPSWVVYHGKSQLKTEPSKNGLQQFTVPSGSRDILIEFSEQRNYNVGWIISLITLLSVVVYPIIRKKWKQKE